jgi:hypothetical protein
MLDTTPASPPRTASLPQAPSRAKGLRRNSGAISVMLLVQYSLGMAVNLFEDVPGSDRHRGILGSALHAVTHTPAGLAFHAILGTLLIVAAISVSVRAWRTRSRKAIAAAVLALVFVLGAWVSGAAFVDQGKDVSSFVMALLTGLAAACYVTTALIAARLEHRSHQPPTQRGP